MINNTDSDNDYLLEFADFNSVSSFDNETCLVCGINILYSISHSSV